MSLSLIGVGVTVSDARVNVKLLIGVVVMYVVVGVVVDIDVYDCGLCGGVVVSLCFCSFCSDPVVRCCVGMKSPSALMLCDS